MNCAYVTLVSNDEYVWGGICLGVSFQKLNPSSKYSFVIMASEEVSEQGLKILKEANVGRIIHIPAKKFAKASENYKVTRQKIEILKLIEYDRICFLDADCILKNNLDEELEQYKTLFGLRINEINLNKEKQHIRGEAFIITPNIMLYNALDKLHYHFQNDEECLEFACSDNLLLPNIMNEDIFLKKVIHCPGPHMCEEKFPLVYLRQKKYWQGYNMTLDLANDLVEYLQQSI